MFPPLERLTAVRLDVAWVVVKPSGQAYAEMADAKLSADLSHQALKLAFWTGYLG
jgi:hypothetical protein